MTKLWQRDVKENQAGKPIRKNRRLRTRPAKAEGFTRSKAAGGSAGENAGKDPVNEKRGIKVSDGLRLSILVDPGEPEF